MTVKQLEAAIQRPAGPSKAETAACTTMQNDAGRTAKSHWCGSDEEIQPVCIILRAAAQKRGLAVIIAIHHELGP